MANHKGNYETYIDPEYGNVEEVDEGKITENFQFFLAQALAVVPNEGGPKSAYNYNAHMGQFVRYLDAAKEEYRKALLAFHGTQGHGKRKIEMI